MIQVLHVGDPDGVLGSNFGFAHCWPSYVLGSEPADAYPFLSMPLPLYPSNFQRNKYIF